MNDEKVGDDLQAGDVAVPSREGLKRFPEMAGMTATVAGGDGDSDLLTLVIPRTERWHRMFWEREEGE